MWKIVFIIGYVEIVVYDVGSINNRGNLVDKKVIVWFVELWLWYVVFFIFSIGIVLCGFKDGVIFVL